MIIKHRKIFYTISGIFFGLSVLALLLWGLKPGIDFTGGALLELEYRVSRPEVGVLQQLVADLKLGNVVFQPSGDRGLFLRLRDISEEEHQSLLAALSLGKPVDATLVQKQFDSVGPVIGKELARKSWIAIVLVVLVIIIFIAAAFRKVSRPVSSWVYGAVAVIALIHDVTIPAGVFAILGHFKGVEIDILFVSALLTILGFSVQDTIVVFDRTRENLKKGIKRSFEETVNASLMQVVGRSIKTSTTIVLVLLALLVFGGETTKYFALALTLGMIFGTYSSIFLASPMLVSWFKWREKK